MTAYSRPRRPTSSRSIPLLLMLLCMVPAAAQQDGPTVVASKARQTDLFEEVRLSGSVVSPRVAELSTEVSGIVATVDVDIGDRVRAGDQILRLDAELETLSLAATSAVREQATQELEDARRRLADARALGEIQSVSANQIKSLAAEVRIDGAELKRARAEEQRLQARLKRYRLKAPFTGIISRKHVEQGEWIQPGQAVVELIAFDGLRIDFQVPQSTFGKLTDSTTIRIRLEALPGQLFEGRIETIIPVTDTTTRTFMIRAALKDKTVSLAPGMSASAVLRIESGKQGVVVHRDALIRYPDGRVTLWVVEKAGEQSRVSEHRVQTGPGFNGMIAITSGISPDALVVVQGNEALREGQTVVVRQAEQEAD